MYNELGYEERASNDIFCIMTLFNTLSIVPLTKRTYIKTTRRQGHSFDIPSMVV